MNCYHCGVRLTEENFCTNCGADVGTYKTIMMTANRFYNQALEKAKVRDLSGALICLRQCLKFNKAHVEARNLLGLVYFELGEVVAALSEWVISTNLRNRKNIAEDYIAMVQNNPSRLDTWNQAIKKYNQALLYCQQDSKDLAIIQLKSVVSMNPKYVRAHLLLGLLYLDAEDYTKAMKQLEKVLQIDHGNTQALLYMKEAEKILHPTDEDGVAKVKRKKKEDIVKYTVGNETIIQPAEFHEPHSVTGSAVIYMVMGLVIGVAISFFLILPARIQNAKADMTEQLKVVSEQLNVKSADMESLNQEMDSLKSLNEQLQSEVDKYVGTDGTLQTMDDLLNAVNTYINNPDDVTAVAEALEKLASEVDINGTSDAFQNVYNAMLAKVGPLVAEQYLEDGLQAYKDGNYSDAITNLEKAKIYDVENDNILYNLANAYRKNGDDANAALYFKEVVEKYPGTDRARKSQRALEELGVDTTEG